MKKKIEDKLKEISARTIRTHEELIVQKALIECLESLLVAEPKPNRELEKPIS